ncbi:hypothetical protein [Chondrinema litorale]|uniref:hypothetical protein n=1 Tax=Chondrinema litorale TaxID=2994555 RepID=UPI002543511D|nr:hypothetical protein [Chondrinema litorale]UZR99472.1 hypothetical protein OQ292_37005 [Chondrinema litorale]
MKKFFRFVFHLISILILTILTQIGGLVYLFTLILVSKKSKVRSIKRAGTFTILYLICTLLVVPNLAPLLGREKIKESESIVARSIIFTLANRNYVKPELNNVLAQIASDFEKKHAGIKLVYLDANFPFFDKFPLLPHLSHNDGKKIDIVFIYEDSAGTLTNLKPSRSGYGIYESPTAKEFNQIVLCKERGYWQYDFPKYLTLGEVNRDLTFSQKATKNLIKIILRQAAVEKIFIEPHLKKRMHLSNNKIRFHGCGAVRHDDHIHLQVK